MTKRTREILGLLDEVYGTEYKCYLNYETPWQLLIATMLSAQCTDARVNLVTETLFKKYDSLEKFADADVKELEQDIHSTGFYHSKAKNIIACAKRLVEDYNGEVPKELDRLTSLAGVGRKTANVMLSVGFGKPAFAVDTHVFRVANRIGLADGKTPDDVEKQVTSIVPEEKWGNAHHWLIHHGRRICHAQNPDCENCPVRICCKFYAEKNKN